MRVEIDGAAQLVNRLQKFDKEIYRILERELKAAAMLVAKDARGRVPRSPLSNWGRWMEATTSRGTRGVVTMSAGGRDLSFNPAAARRGIKAQVPKRYRKGAIVGFKVQVVQMNPAGAIYELAGSVTKDTMGKNLNGKNGDSVWPRTLGPAYNEKGDEAARGIEDAIDRAVKALD